VAGRRPSVSDPQRKSTTDRYHVGLIQREVPAFKGGGVSKVPRLPVDCEG
jgi:hypothetical protein